jgi:NAD(P)-dependent dehydrogenase (short-subunit alcohol dehydrogenase family)
LELNPRDQLLRCRSHHACRFAAVARRRSRHDRDNLLGHSFLPDPLVMDYSAAKAALANFCKALSKEVGPRGIRVNMVSPGPVSTGLWLGSDGVAATVARATGGQPDAVADQAAKDSVTGRFTQPQEVADLVLLLASSRAGNVTGADFVIDGGLTTAL